MATKKPSAKQLAARAKFVKMVRAKAAAKKKIKSKPSRLNDLLLLDEIKGRLKKAAPKKINGAKNKIKYTYGVYKRDAYGSHIPNSQKIVSVTRTNEETAKNVVYKKYPPSKYFVELITSKLGMYKKATAKKATKLHKDTKSHNVNVSVVSGVGAKTQAGAIRNIYMKRNLRKAGFSVPTEIATNDLQKIYKSVFGKQPITIAKIKVQLKKGVAPSDIINK